MKTLAEYLNDNFERDVIEHTLRVYVLDEQICFYIHPANVSGETLDFVVKENSLDRVDNKTVDVEIVAIPHRMTDKPDL